MRGIFFHEEAGQGPNSGRHSAAKGPAPLRFLGFSWSLVVLASAVVSGCGGGGGFAITSCTPGEDETCPEGYICQLTEAGQSRCLPEIQPAPPESCTPGEEGFCEEGEVCKATGEGVGACVPADRCSLDGTWACGESEACRNTSDTPEGQGTCLPADRCTLDGTWACGEGEACRNTADTPEGQGTCLPEDRCSLAGAWGCPEEGQLCWDTDDTPSGQGTCVPKGSCALQRTGECVLGEVCLEAPGLPAGVGTCVPQICEVGNDESCPGDLKCWKPEGAEDGLCVPANHCEEIGEACGEDGTWVCKPALGVPSGTGLCLEPATCVVGAVGGCSGSALCKPSNRPDGLGLCLEETACVLGAAGGCAPNLACKPETEGEEIGLCLAPDKCTPGTTGGCNGTDTCWSTGDCVPTGTCSLGNNDTCAGTLECKPGTGLPAGAGVCLAPDKCTPGTTGGCSGTNVCWSTGDCVPDNTCELNNDTCDGTDLCKPAPGLPAGAGLCLGVDACYLSMEGGCEAGFECKPITPTLDRGLCMTEDKCVYASGAGCGDGICWTTGDCVPPGTCTLGNNSTCAGTLECKPAMGLPTSAGVCLAPDKCTPGVAGGCGGSDVCWSTGDCVPPGTCTLGNDGTCPGTDLCKPGTDLPTGAGVCLAPDKCTPGVAGGCSGSDVCWSTGDCVPDNTCELGSGACAGTLECKPATGLPTGAGLCLAPDKCVPGAAGGCGGSDVCWSTGDCVPTGTCSLGNNSTCADTDVCKPATGLPAGAGVCLAPDKCSPGTSSGCSGTDMCWSTGDCVPENTCTLGNDDTCHGMGLCKPAPDLPEGAGECLEEDACYISMEGGCGAGFECKPTAPAQEIGLCMPEGKCVYGSGGGCSGSDICWSTGDCVPSNVCENIGTACGTNLECKAATGLPVGLGLCLGEGACVPGRVECAAGLQCKPSLTAGGPGICLAPDACLVGAPDNCAEGLICLPPESGDIGRCIIPDLAFETGLLNTHLPLAWTDGHVVIGTSDGTTSGAVSFYNVEEPGLTGLEVGALTGIVSLGDSGRVALSTNGSDARTSLVNSSGAFVHASGMDCVRGAAGLGGVGENASFPHGLSLLSIGNADGGGDWRFAVPLNDNTQGSLLAYMPNGGSVANNCVRDGTLGGGLALAPLVGMDNPREVMTMSGQSPTLVRFWEYNPTTSSWTDTGTSTGRITTSIDRVFSVAVTHANSRDHFWLTAEDNSGLDLMRGLFEDGTTAFITLTGQNIQSMGGLALDEEGRAYVVKKPAATGYELRRYASFAYSGTQPGDYETITLPQTSAAPVGSPVLGQPLPASPAELYVLMTDGYLYALNASTFELLWMRRMRGNDNQPMLFSPTAQPILHGNRLWLIGTKGELRGVAVGSNGLSQSAQWPKMHRDNCNTSSRFSTPARLQSCF